jgi:uncharacterized protein YndB with AHSA1/START domain
MSKKKKVSHKSGKKGQAKKLLKKIKKEAKSAAKKADKKVVKPAKTNASPKKAAVKKVKTTVKTAAKKSLTSKKSDPLKKAANHPSKAATKSISKPAIKGNLKKNHAPQKTAVNGAKKPETKPVHLKIAVSKKSEFQKAEQKNGQDKNLKSHINVAPPEFKKDGKKPAPATNEKGKSADSKKSGEKRPDVLAITNTIPVKKANEISLSKIASISHSITNPVKRTDSYAVRTEKEPTGKFEMEFVVHSSAEMLYEFLSTPSGLSEWFCDDLNIRNGIYTFIWDDQLQQARLLKTIDQHLVRFQWVDKTDGSYFEFRIQKDDLTNDIALIITDFAETSSERESSKLLWHSQIEKLMHVIGSIF